MVGVAMPQPKGPGALADWSPADRSAHDETVEVYSNAPEVELFLNGRSLGRKPRNADDSARAWTVPFAAGTLRAVGWQGKRVVASDQLATAGTPAALRLTPRGTPGPGFDQAGLVEVEVVHAKGTVVPGATPALTATVETGTLAAFDNGSITDHTAFASPTRNAEGGRALIAVRGDGRGAVSVRVTGEGVRSTSVRFR